MNKLWMLVLIALLSGCATHLTESGHRIKVIATGDPTLTSRCEKIGRVRGETASFLSSGDYGVVYATNDARNKAGQLSRADTLEILNDEPRRLGGEVTGIVYNCLSPKAASVATSPQAVVTQRSIAPEKTVPITVQKDSGVIFEKAKKCQIKGGVWVNDTCIIQID